MIKVGEWYWAAGTGPVQVTVLPDGVAKTTVTVRPLVDVDVWVAPTSLVPLSTKTMRTYESEMRARLTLTPSEEERLALCLAWLLEHRK